MFDIGFWELALVFVIAVVVVGPQRLPEVVRSCMSMINKAKNMFNDAKESIERELDLDEIKDLKRELEKPLTTLNDAKNDIISQYRALDDEVARNLNNESIEIQNNTDESSQIEFIFPEDDNATIKAVNNGKNAIK